MKKLIFIVFSVFLMSYSTCYSQRKEVMLKFKDGTILHGYGKLIGENGIAFRESLDEKATKYDFSQIQYFQTTEGDEYVRFSEFPVKGKNYSIVVQEYIIGTLSLYTTTDNGWATASGGIPVSYSNVNYYLKQNTSDSLIDVKKNKLFSGKFKDKASEFFKSCPVLSYNIKNKKKGFRKREIADIVNYYNQKCYR